MTIRFTFPIKGNTETKELVFDFTGALAPGEVISAAQTLIYTYSGGDAYPNNVLSGGPVVVGSTVQQEVTGGVVGVTYDITCTVSTNQGNTYDGEGLLTVVGKVTAVSTTPGVFESQTTAALSAAAAAISASQATDAAQSALACAMYRTVLLVTFANSPFTPTVDESGTLYVVDTTNGSVAFNLPALSSLTLPYTFGVKLAAGANQITINGAPNDPIDQVAGSPKNLSSLGNGIHFVATTTSWFTTNFGSGGSTASGNVTSSATTSVDGELALFSGTSGIAIKRASGTGIAKVTSGVFSVAVSGTDYCPPTSGTALQKGNGSGGLTAATAGVDYYATDGALGTPSSGTLTNCTFPTLNQNTTGSAAKWTTARLLAGNSVDGSADAAFANKFIVQGTADSGLSGAQFLGALATGMLKSTTNTGVLSIGVAGTDYVAPSGALGTPTSGVLTNCTGTASGLTAGSVTGLTVTTGKTLTINNSIILAGNDGASLTIGSGGTLGSAAFSTFPLQTGNNGKVLTTDGTNMSWGTLGAGTVTSVSVVTANGFSGTVATSTSTPAITLQCTANGILKSNSTAISAATAGTDYGYAGIPQSSHSAAYTTVLADANTHLLHPSADTTARTFTIDSNANVAYPIGTTLTFVNQHGAGVLTIAITTDTMYLAGAAATTGSRTLTAYGIATALKVTSTEWVISGTGLT